MDRLTIGQMSKINNVSEQTLRYYDKIGILKPIEVDKFTGYRYYSMKQCARLDMIQYLKSLGMRLKDIEVQLKTCDTKLIKDFGRKSRNIDAEIEGLKHQKCTSKSRATMKDMNPHLPTVQSPLNTLKNGGYTATI